MGNLQRIYQLHRILASRTLPVSHQTLEQLLECSRATVNRTIESLRLYFNAPILYDRERTAITTNRAMPVYLNCPVFGLMRRNCTRC
ncbi:HTH domain-containing protein [Nitrosomonas oligotropha]|uniref:HTH domain-containing protein n=1 Tax=Nitrosomonas oligotropha TaxID=42354 RepID=A0A1H8JRH3_9PROT|nr:HTH domain-containing protein [Nitrosomonas oligotropha]SDW01116.1 HTH domain-containing protein [Nitrosomonas oligotropha]SEN83312.1 HTH domain-containing protein [Nitrosomonas oligotropha]